MDIKNNVYHNNKTLKTHKKSTIFVLFLYVFMPVYMRLFVRF